MNFVFGGNGFFGYFFSESIEYSPHRDSPYHISEPGDSLAWWSTYTADECPTPGTLDREAVTRQIRERHKNWKDPVVQKVLQHLQVDNMYPTWTVPPLPTWERDGVVLVGDAAHALPPTSGQGSSQALEDVEAFALFLGHYLRKAYQEHKTDMMSRKQVIKTAAEQYMNLRLPRVTLILKDAQRTQNTKRDKGVVEEYVMYAFMWVSGKAFASNNGPECNGRRLTVCRMLPQRNGEENEHCLYLQRGRGGQESTRKGRLILAPIECGSMSLDVRSTSYNNAFSCTSRHCAMQAAGCQPEFQWCTEYARMPFVVVIPTPASPRSGGIEAAHGSRRRANISCINATYQLHRHVTPPHNGTIDHLTVHEREV